MPDKYALVQEEIAKGGSYQQELLKVVCGIAEGIENIGKLIKPEEIIVVEEVKQVEKSVDIPVKRKPGRPKRR